MPSLKTDLEDAILQPGIEAIQTSAKRPPRSDQQNFLRRRVQARRALWLLLVSLGAMAIAGYHPYAEDAGIYVAGIKRAAHPGLYGSAFFLEPYLHVSVFPHLSAWIFELLHIPIENFLLALQFLTTWLLVFSCWALARHCFVRSEERWAAVLLTATCLSVPVAGSSLFLMDPYLTSRSISTPLSLLALVACLDRKFLRAVLLLMLIGVFHPLMAVYAAFFVLLLWAVQADSLPGVVALVVAGFASVSAVTFSQRNVIESVAYRYAVGSRCYFFLSNWRWYEQFGLLAPVMLLAIYAYRARSERSTDIIRLARTCVIFGVASIAIALSFARESSHSHLVAALQPLRPFLLIYFCMFLIVGGIVGRTLLKRSAWRWVLFFAATVMGLAFTQKQGYPASPQFELPATVSQNGWTRAFLWIRDNTSVSDRFALDADYIDAPGEDGQGFRAVAERDSLADQSKDGGAAAVFRQLAERWWIEQTATTDLNRIDDAERLRRLAPFHVDWIVLNASATTQLPCPFLDDAVRVCRLR